MARQSEYKPLLYTTTVRNPERYKDFIHLLKKFDGQILTADVVEQFEREAFKCGLYRPKSVFPNQQSRSGATRHLEILVNTLSPTKKPKPFLMVMILVFTMTSRDTKKLDLKKVGKAVLKRSSSY